MKAENKTLFVSYSDLFKSLALYLKIKKLLRFSIGKFNHIFAGILKFGRTQSLQN